MLGAIAMAIRPRCMLFRVVVADTLARLAEPDSCPGELGAENGQPDRDYDETRARRYEHDDA